MNSAEPSLQSQFHKLHCAGDFWSLRMVDETADTYVVRKNVAATARVVARSRRDADRLGQRWQRLRGHERSFGRRFAGRARPRDRVGTRDGSGQPDRFQGAGQARTTRRIRLARRRDAGLVAPRLVRAACGGIAFCRLRRAHRRLGNQRRDPDRHARLSHQYGRRRDPALSLRHAQRGRDGARRRRHPNPIAQRLSRAGAARQRGDAGAFWLCRQRAQDCRRSVAAVGRTELPDRHHGRPADARSDGPADSRVDWPSRSNSIASSATSAISRGRASSPSTCSETIATARICSTSPSTRPVPKSSPAMPSTTTVRARKSST